MLQRMTEKMCMTIAWWLPRQLVKWCAVRLMAHATTGQWSSQIVPELRVMDALNRWDIPQHKESANGR